MGMFAAPEGVPEPALCWKFMVTLSPANSRAVLHEQKTSLGVQGRVLSKYSCLEPVVKSSQPLLECQYFP